MYPHSQEQNVFFLTILLYFKTIFKHLPFFGKKGYTFGAHCTPENNIYTNYSGTNIYYHNRHTPENNIYTNYSGTNIYYHNRHNTPESNIYTNYSGTNVYYHNRHTPENNIYTNYSGKNIYFHNRQEYFSLKIVYFGYMVRVKIRKYSKFFALCMEHL